MQEETAIPTATGDDDVVVDNVDSTPISLNNKEPEAPKDFVVGPQQVLGLDQAVLQSIDRCRKFYFLIVARFFNAAKVNQFFIKIFFQPRTI